MNHFLLLVSFILISSCTCIAQFRPIQLHLQKNGRVKKRFEPGTMISIIDRSGDRFVGPVRLMNDTLLINDSRIALNQVRRFKIVRENQRKFIDWKELGWVTGGVIISTIGMALAGWETWPAAAITSVVLGYSPYLFRKIMSISFKKYNYRIGGRYRLRVWDLN